MKKKVKQKLSDSRNVKPQAKKLNPFEVHINRKKYDILGMKSKSERGLPGISRAKSLKKRKVTLLQEYKMKDKKNTFLDRRIGERNKAMTAEDKILARYAAERMKFHSKKSIYNLGDDEELTHRGQTLTEIEKFDNPRSEDEDEEEEGDGKLDSDFVGDAHFGGGIFKKVEGESKSRKDLIDQLIAESIKRKAEKQKLRQQTLDLTQKLDTEWKELLPLVTASKKSKSDPEPDSKKDDKFANYDIMSKKLKFEARGKPSDRLKSEEELAKEEKEKLEKLERERIQRMLGDTQVKTVKHRSADDLDDGFDLNNEPETFLTYKNGVLDIEGNEDPNDSEDESIDKTKTNEKKEKDEEEAEEEMDVDEEEEGEDEYDDEDDDNDDDENSEESDSDNLSDLKDSDDDNVDDEDKPHKITQKISEQLKREALNAGKTKKETTNSLTGKTFDKEIEKDIVETANALETARNELPYTFKIPKEYDEFEELMKNYSPDYQAVVIERMIKCHHPSLKENFKDDLDLLYTFMLQHLQDCASDYSSKINCFKILDRLAPWFYDLTQWNPQNCCSGLIEVIKEKHQDFLKSPKIYPSLDTLIFLKLVSILFPTSDYRHPVVTPSLVFMQQILFECRVQSSVDLSRGLFITTLLLEYCALSKKFVPETINFLRGVLRLAHPKNSEISNEPQFDVKNKYPVSLVISDKSSNIVPRKLCVSDLIQKNETEEFKISVIKLALTLLSRFSDFWTEDQPAIVIFEPFIKLLDSEFCESLRKDVDEVLGKLLKLKKRNLRMLVLEKKKPMPLRLYEPKIEQVYSLKNYRPMGKKKAERAKLMHKYKREMKGALREIRRDRSFIAKLKFKETVKSDTERQRKVREIFGAAAEQAGELNKLQRKKKK